MGTLSATRDELSVTQRIVRCQTSLTLQDLDPDDAKTLSEVIADKSIGSTTIFKWLKKNNINIGIDSLRRHRRGDCNCSRVSS